MKIKHPLMAMALAAAVFSSSAYAEWEVHTIDDLLSGEKKTILLNELNSEDVYLAFTCAEKSLSVSYLEADSATLIKNSKPIDLALKIDTNKPILFDAQLSRRDAKMLEVSSSDEKQVKRVLTRLKNAKSKIEVSVQNKEGENLATLFGTVHAATLAINKFTATCKIAL